MTGVGHDTVKEAPLKAGLLCWTTGVLHGPNPE